MATIALEGMHFYANHGFYEEERLIGNHFVLDVYLSAAVFRATMTDDLFATVNYETVHFLCQTEMKKPTKLLETVVQRIMDRLQEHFEGKISGIKIRLTKLNPPLKGLVDKAYVEISAGSFSAGEKGGGLMF